MLNLAKASETVASNIWTSQYHYVVHVHFP